MVCKKGQGIGDSLIYVGIVLIIILVIGGVVIFFGLLDPPRKPPERCEIAPGITCLDFNARTDDKGDGDAEDTIKIILNNGIGESMHNVFINVTGCNIEEKKGAISEIITEMKAGQNYVLNITGCGGMFPETKFKSDLDLHYVTVSDGKEISHTKKGYLIVAVN